MKFGVCSSMVVNDLRSGGIEVIETIARLGYDYIELSLTHLAALPQSDFQGIKKRIKNSGIRCECCNNFFPPEMKLTGRVVNMPKIEEYSKHALGRASQLGAGIVVFGSGPAKTVPPGYPKGEAILQLIELCRKLAPIAANNGIVIVIEPLRKAECNIINNTFEGMQLAKQAESANIQLLIDYFHSAAEKENPDIIMAASRYIKHIHFAKSKGRSFPVNPKEEAGYDLFFNNLIKIGYDERISIEGYSSNFEEDAVKSYSFLKKIFPKDISLYN
jgi:D-psicose/D-tagatose/L-ribulose 3-epimerase